MSFVRSCPPEIHSLIARPCPGLLPHPIHEVRGHDEQIETRVRVAVGRGHVVGIFYIVR